MAQALAIAGPVLKAGSTIFSSRAEAKQLKSQANQLDDHADATEASSQRDSIEQRRQSRLLQSRALAVAAASGGGADDPGVINAIADLEGEGEYRALTALYNGSTEADGLRAQAKARRKEAKNTKTAGLLNAASTVLSAGSSMADRFG